MIRALLNMRDALRDRERHFIAWADDLALRGRAGLLGRWPWQPRPDTRHIYLDVCSVRPAAEQVGRVALAETGAEFVVVHYRNPDGAWDLVVVERGSE